MKSRTINNIVVHFPPEEEQTADVIAEVCENVPVFARQAWNLPMPRDCCIYVMASWLGFYVRSAPPVWRIYLAATLPLWSYRVQRMWPYAGAWTQRFGKKVAIGIKPPRLWEQSDKTIGRLIMVPEPDVKAKIRAVACHELVHACSAHLRLPPWLNEGIAMASVDQLLGKPTVRQDTLQLMQRSGPKPLPTGNRGISDMDVGNIAYEYVRGYWLVRYLEETHPGLLAGMLSKRHRAAWIEDYLAVQIGLEQGCLWSSLDSVIADHFKSSSDALA